MPEANPVEAAQAAQFRAAQCRARRHELAARQPIRPDDVGRAMGALGQALQRAAAAQQRLHSKRGIKSAAATWSRPGAAPGYPDDRQPLWEDALALRARARSIPFDDLYLAYLAIGGTCTEFDLDAFVHVGITLPADQLAVLGHAVWELTEF